MTEDQRIADAVFGALAGHVPCTRCGDYYNPKDKLFSQRVALKLCDDCMNQYRNMLTP